MEEQGDKNNEQVQTKQRLQSRGAHYPPGEHRGGQLREAEGLQAKTAIAELRGSHGRGEVHEARLVLRPAVG
eukprot:7665371-Pyramimonas_sp.AAC.1